MSSPTHPKEAFKHPLYGAPVYRCTYCGRFYSARTKHKHRVCHMIEGRREAGQ